MKGLILMILILILLLEELQLGIFSLMDLRLIILLGKRNARGFPFLKSSSAS